MGGDAGRGAEHVFALRGGGIEASARAADRMSDAAPVGDGNRARSLDRGAADVRPRNWIFAEPGAEQLTLGDVLRIGIWAAVILGAFVWLLAR